MEYGNSQLMTDINFLANRQLRAGTFGGSNRDTGVSSNCIVAIAYGLLDINEQYLPSDRYDLEACERMWKKLPEHRKKGKALEAMNLARQSISDKK